MRLNVLATSFLDLARLESGRVQFSKSSFPFKPLVDDCKSVMQSKADESRITTGGCFVAENTLLAHRPDTVPVLLRGVLRERHAIAKQEKTYLDHYIIAWEKSRGQMQPKRRCAICAYCQSKVLNKKDRGHPSPVFSGGIFRHQPFLNASISIRSPVTMNTVRSQMLVTRSAKRSRLWAAHKSQLARSIFFGSVRTYVISSR